MYKCIFHFYEKEAIEVYGAIEFTVFSENLEQVFKNADEFLGFMATEKGKSVIVKTEKGLHFLNVHRMALKQIEIEKQ